MPNHSDSKGTEKLNLPKSKVSSHPGALAGTGAPLMWQVRFELASDRSIALDLNISGEFVLGRGQTSGSAVDLSPYDAENLGVSRSHAILRPTMAQLFVLDSGSTNGTQLNGRRLVGDSPHRLTNGDLLTLGSLEFVVRIVKRPTGHTAALRDKADLGDALAMLAKAITSQLELDEVLDQALEMAMGLTAAGETAIWLVDEHTGELFLEAQRGIHDERVKRVRLPVADSLAGKVIETGEPIRVRSERGGEQVQIKTDYLVEALIYAPLALGGVTFGVLAAAHREPGKQFSAHDEKLLMAIADFAAIAIQNARLYEMAEKTLAELHKGLAHDLRGPLASIKGLAQMVQRITTLDEVPTQFIQRIVDSSDRVLALADEILDVALVAPASQLQHAQCDLESAVSRAIADLRGAALVKSIDLKLAINGTPYQIRGDSSRLHRSVLNLIDNAIKYSPDETQISVILSFGDEQVTIQIRDDGPGIPEEELPRIFDKYFRGTHGEHTTKSGIGLGLSMVEATAKAHGGEVTVRNADGGGAEFTIALPADLRIADTAI
jgi:signal transduction histidine kinase